MRVLNEAAIFQCIRCSKPLGTQKMIGNMLARLADHSMFAEAGALERLKMCADCRVIDMMQKGFSVAAEADGNRHRSPGGDMKRGGAILR